MRILINVFILCTLIRSITRKRNLLINQFSRLLVALVLATSVALMAIQTPTFAQDDTTQTASIITSDDQQLRVELPADWATATNADEIVFGEDSDALLQFDNGDQDAGVVGLGGVLVYFDAATTISVSTDGLAPSAPTLFNVLASFDTSGVVFALPEPFISLSATDALVAPFELAGNTGRFYVFLFGDASAILAVYNIDAASADAIASSVVVGPVVQGQEISYVSSLYGVNRAGDALELTMTVPEGWLNVYDSEAETLHFAENQAVLDYIINSSQLVLVPEGEGGSISMFGSQLFDTLYPDGVIDLDAIVTDLTSNFEDGTIVGVPTEISVAGFDARSVVITDPQSTAILYVLLNDDVLILLSYIGGATDRTLADTIVASIGVVPAASPVSAVPINPSAIPLTQTASASYEGLTASINLPDGWTFDTTTPDQLTIDFASDADTLQAVQSTDLSTVSLADFAGVGASLNIFDPTFLSFVLVDDFSASALYGVLTNGVTEISFGDGVDYPVEGFSSGVRGPLLVNDAPGVMYVLLNDAGAVVIIGLSADGDLGDLDAIAATATLAPTE